MRWRLTALLVLLFIITACTGTTETPPPAVLAVGSGSEVQFFPAYGFWPASGTVSPLGTWRLPLAAGPVVDMAAPSGQSTLWVLTRNYLYVFSTLGVTTRGVGSLPPGKTISIGSPNAAADCTNGYLRTGAEHLLVVCSSSDVWMFPYADLPSTLYKNHQLDTSGFPADTHYALLSKTTLGDVLAFLYTSGSKVTVGYYVASTALFVTQKLELGFGSQYQAQGLAILPDTETGSGTLFGLVGSTTGVNSSELIRWNGNRNTEPVGFSVKTGTDSPIAATRMALDTTGIAPQVVVYSGPSSSPYDRGLAVSSSDALWARQTYTSYDAATVGADGYLYLASGPDEAVSLGVYDLYAADPLLNTVGTAAGLRIKAPSAMVYLPVRQ